MSSAHLRSQTLSLYRSLLRSIKQWPPQSRAHRLEVQAPQWLREEFTANSELSEGEWQAKLAEGQKELESLQALVGDKVEAQYPFSDSSRIIAFMPSKKMFSLLDTEAQEQLKPENVSTFKFLGAYIATKYKIGMSPPNQQ
ncbi:uncharacterized protein BJ171DRAFT_516842 [Polychytrium aggregatum]|uniref:uncharacterized protein n=1 Tax=Polychytrium aggregatum TaxID=110093 RepID=UPI0022FF2537|nr:uncharacterized protein BJ171DRAFT_516842 [Polychytrium aggregatum]KAI9201894.1 hypothetical protein BJ171DRAFT_516842 [Polychytrium aggregatum]